MAIPPAPRDRLRTELEAGFPGIHWGLSEEGGWSSGYLIHVEPEDDDLDDDDRILGDDDPPDTKPAIAAVINRHGWILRRYDDEGRLFFLAPGDDEQPSLEAD